MSPDRCRISEHALEIGSRSYALASISGARAEQRPSRMLATLAVAVISAVILLPLLVVSSEWALAHGHQTTLQAALGICSIAFFAAVTRVVWWSERYCLVLELRGKQVAVLETDDYQLVISLTSRVNEAVALASSAAREPRPRSAPAPGGAAAG